MRSTRKALNYDLDDKLLKKYYPNTKSYKNAWTIVKKFLYDKKFENRQYSGVVSIEPMTYATVQEIILELSSTYDWLGPCVERFDVTSVGPKYNLENLFVKKSESLKH